METYKNDYTKEEDEIHLHSSTIGFQRSWKALGTSRNTPQVSKGNGKKNYSRDKQGCVKKVGGMEKRIRGWIESAKKELGFIDYL